MNTRLKIPARAMSPLALSTLLMACVLWTSSISALSLIGGKKEEQLLEPSQAFQTQVSLSDNNLLQVEINTAPGYYIYRKKIAVNSDNAVFGPLQLPDGEKKQDEFFGEVETYRGMLQYSAPLTSTQVTGPLKITVTSQGCADVGVCYPPYSEDFTVNVKDAIAQSKDSNSATQLQLSNNAQVNNLANDPVPQDAMAGSFSNGLGLPKVNNEFSSSSSSVLSQASDTGSLSDMLRIDGGDDEVLDPEIAFTLDPVRFENGVATFKWNIQEGHYLYKKRFSVEVISPDNTTLGEKTMDNGVWEEDAFFGKSEVYRGSAVMDIPVSLPDNLTEAMVKVGYQGCADIGICYPPTFKNINLVASASIANSGYAPGNSINNSSGDQSSIIKTAGAVDNTLAAVSQQANVQTDVAPMAEQDRLANSLKSGNRWLTIATFFGMGLLLTFTPCVLPMVPILSSIIVGNGEKISTGRAFSLSLIYVLAMALTYTVAGVLIGLSGENIQATLQHPYVLGAFALLFVVLSLSMFGFYELQMPQSIQNRLTSVSNKQTGGSFSGVATMGFLSALIVGPCVTAPLVGALIYIGQTGDAVLGGAALFALSMGMGLPLLIIGTTFGKYLPRAGKWMDVTKAIFGVMLLGLAIYMLDRVIPAWATMLLSALLLITVAMFMGAFDSLPADARGWRRVTKGFGFAALVYGVLLMIGVATGTGTLLRPMQGLSLASNPDGKSSTEHVEFQTVKTIDQLNAKLAEARASNTPVMFDFYADWCISCKEMEAFTFTDPKVASTLNRGILLQADVTANDEHDKALLKEFGIFGPPAIIFYDEDGVEQKNARVVGFMPADKFSTVLDRVFY